MRGVLFLEVNTLAREIAETTAPERVVAALASSFASLASILAGTGLVGLLSYTVRQRRREVGIRMALVSAAQRSHIVYLFGIQTVGITFAGLLTHRPSAECL